MVHVTPLWFHESLHNRKGMSGRLMILTWGIYTAGTVIPLGQKVAVDRDPKFLEEFIVSKAKAYVSLHPDEYFEVIPFVVIPEQGLGRNAYLASTSLRRSQFFDSRVFVDAVNAFVVESQAVVSDLPQVRKLSSEPKKVIVATDGSYHAYYGGSSYGWVADNGLFASRSIDTKDILMAELHAIKDALRSLHRASPKSSSVTEVIVITDSQIAINLLTDRDGRRKAKRNPKMKSAATLAASVKNSGRAFQSVTYTWQRAHVGHPLNEAADSLARNRRLSKFNSVSNDILSDVEKNIAAEGLKLFSSYKKLED